jgi:hypothetical protein
MIKIKTSKYIIRFLLIICISLIYNQGANAQFLILQSAFGNGCAVVSDSGYCIIGTVGQPVIGTTTGSSNNSYSGFWYQENSIMTSVVKDLQNILPKEYRIEQNFPNPFNPSTTISWQMPEGSLVTLKVYDILGNEVASLVNGFQKAGVHSITFNTQNAAGSRNLSSGVYFYRLSAGNFVSTKKMVLVK